MVPLVLCQHFLDHDYTMCSTRNVATPQSEEPHVALQPFLLHWETSEVSSKGPFQTGNSMPGVPGACRTRGPEHAGKVMIQNAGRVL